jgi:hypothetical protein
MYIAAQYSTLFLPLVQQRFPDDNDSVSSSATRERVEMLAYSKELAQHANKPKLMFDFMLFKFYSTATADGQMMAQMLSTFSKLEQSRFEAFRRSTVPADAVHEWLAACLADRYSVSPPAAQGGAGKSRSLADLVQPGQADSISMVVATLAKVYAQRLVSEAQRLAQEDSIKSNNNEVVTADEQQNPLQPQHIRRAWEHRKRQGLDPGFFLQANEGLQWSSGGQAGHVHDCRRLAALAAQEEYDAHVAKEEQKEKDARPDEMDVEPSSPKANAVTME